MSMRCLAPIILATFVGIPVSILRATWLFCKRPIDLYLYGLLAECYANDEQVLAQLHSFEDIAPNPGIASFDWLNKEFGSTEIEDTMPILLKNVEKELVAGATIAKFVTAFTLQQTQIVAAYTTHGDDGKPKTNKKLLLDHLIVGRARLLSFAGRASS